MRLELTPIQKLCALEDKYKHKLITHDTLTCMMREVVEILIDNGAPGDTPVKLTGEWNTVTIHIPLSALRYLDAA